MDKDEQEYSTLPEDTVPPSCSVATVIIGFVLVSVAVIAFASQFIRSFP